MLFHTISYADISPYCKDLQQSLQSTLHCIYIELYRESIALDKRPSTPGKDKFKSQSDSEHEIESLLFNEMLEIWVSFLHRSLWGYNTRLALPM